MKKQFLQISFYLLVSIVTVAQDLNITDINATGKLKMNGNTGISGQVLTSNGALAPTWSTLTAPLSTVGGRFRFKNENVTAQTVAGQIDNNFITIVTSNTSQFAYMSFLGTDYNTNSDVSINLATGELTFNRTGLYYIETMARLFVTSGGGVVQLEGLAGNLNLTINNSSSALITDQKLFEPAGLVGPNPTYTCIIPLKTTQYFTAGQTLKIKMNIVNLKLNTNLVALGMSQGSYLAGHFISE